MTASPQLKKSYVDGRYGQVHVLSAGTNETDSPPLFLLHATAYSGRTFRPLIEKLSLSRQVIAPDTPGYGGSDGPESLPAFDAYGAAFADLVTTLGGPETQPVDVLGYHTGAFVALEAAVQRPDLIRSLTLIGIPYFTGEEREERRSVLAHKTELTEEFDQFKERWTYFIQNRTPGLSLDRAFECFVDELRVYPKEWWAHEALFTYDTEPCLRGVSCPVLILNPDSPLAAASRAAAELIENAELVDLPSLTGAIFDLGTDDLSAAIEAFLTRLDGKA